MSHIALFCKLALILLQHFFLLYFVNQKKGFSAPIRIYLVSRGSKSHFIEKISGCGVYQASAIFSVKTGRHTNILTAKIGSQGRCQWAYESENEGMKNCSETE